MLIFHQNLWTSNFLLLVDETSVRSSQTLKPNLVPSFQIMTRRDWLNYFPLQLCPLCSWKRSSILSDITKRAERAEISAIRKYKGKTAQSQVPPGWTLPRANSPTYEMIHPRELILMINLPFEYAEKQHFKISSSDLIPSLGQKTAEQSDVEVRAWMKPQEREEWEGPRCLCSVCFTEAVPAHLVLWQQGSKQSWSDTADSSQCPSRGRFELGRCW